MWIFDTADGFARYLPLVDSWTLTFEFRVSGVQQSTSRSRSIRITGYRKDFGMKVQTLPRRMFYGRDSGLPLACCVCFAFRY